MLFVMPVWVLEFVVECTLPMALEVRFSNAAWCTVFELRQGTRLVLALFFEHTCVVLWYVPPGYLLPCSDPDI